MIKHRYNLNPLKKINLYAAPDETNLTVSGTSNDKLIILLTKMVNNEGGLTEYMHKMSTTRPDLVGAVEKSKRNYTCYPGHHKFSNKGKICPTCGVPNLFCQADTPYKPLRSENPDMPLHEVADDFFEYEDCTWEQVDGKWVNTTNIPWRCGLCMSDLRYEPVNKQNEGYVDLFFDHMPYLIGGLLDQLTLIGATDFFDDADE